MRIIVLAIGFLASLAACAQEAPAPAEEKFKEGVHYNVLPQQVRTVTPGKIEVTEAFSYTCGHCFKFEPLITAWDKIKPKDVELVKLQVVANPSTQLLARALYTGKALKISDEVNEAIFNQIHVSKKAIRDEDDFAAIFEKLGVDKEKFTKTFNSFGVSSQVQQAEGRSRAMQIRGTPQMIVDGKYTVSATKDLGHEGMLQVVNFLVDKIREESKK